MAVASDETRAGLPLYEFTRTLPPGWKPGIRDYSFKTYLTRLDLWWRITEFTEEQAGPMVASRLQGTAYTVAMNLRTARDGIEYIGIAALALPPVAADPTHGTPALLSGLQLLLARLTEDFQIHEQDFSTIILDQLFDHRRGHSTLAQYITEHRLYMDEAQQHAGLMMGPVGRSHMLLKYSGLPQRRIDDIKLQIQGDLTRYEELLAILMRIAKSEQQGMHSVKEVLYPTYHEGHDEWSWNTDSWYEEPAWEATDWLDSWYENDDENTEWYALDEWDDEPSEYEEQEYDEYWGSRGRGRGRSK
eukprot:2852034-Lingulodinium_polyedra.AAC.1